ncbi:MAG: peptidoglycan-binding protein LysM, partial [Prevotella sp.]|nr:peptidoglycan-binding protein LysM [Prevotella sp.]
NFFLKGLHQYGADFKGLKSQNGYSHLQTPLNFKQTNAMGGMQNEAFMLVHYTPDNRVESINY